MPRKKFDKVNTLVCDIDEVVCDSRDESVPYYDRKPYPHAVAWLRRLKLAGYNLVLQTARGMDRFEGNLEAVEDYHRDQLEAWLVKYGVPYDRLAFGKEVGCRYIDDLAFQVESKKGEEDWVRLGESLGIPAKDSGFAEGGGV